jgi:putative endonuclease
LDVKGKYGLITGFLLMSKTFYVYILSNKRHGTLYIGVTSELQKRIYKHKNKMLEGFSKKYDLDKIIYYEIYKDSVTAITREKRLKKWKRQWKIKLIEEKNPTWSDLSNEIGL